MRTIQGRNLARARAFRSIGCLGNLALFALPSLPFALMRTEGIALPLLVRGQRVADVITVILCTRCQRAGHVRWGSARPGAKTFKLAHLSAGFRFIEEADGTRRVECAACFTPVEGISGLLGGYEPLGPRI